MRSENEIRKIEKSARSAQHVRCDVKRLPASRARISGSSERKPLNVGSPISLGVCVLKRPKESVDGGYVVNDLIAAECHVIRIGKRMKRIDEPKAVATIK